MALVARIGRYNGDPKRIEDGTRFLSENDISQMPGNRGAVALVDRASGLVLTITFWDSDQAVSGSAGAAASLRDQIARAFGASSPPTAETYEVLPMSRFPSSA
jgi:heme-degrading monooxygenase HmoA